MKALILKANPADYPINEWNKQIESLGIINGEKFMDALPDILWKVYYSGFNNGCEIACESEEVGEEDAG